MAYDTEELKEKALKIIHDEKQQPVFIDELACLMGIPRQTFYAHKLDKIDTIKEGLEQNKISKKSKMRRKWEESDNATLQIANYKLLGTKEELERLSKQSIDVGRSEPSATEGIKMEDIPEELLDQMVAAGLID